MFYALVIGKIMRRFPGILGPVQV